MKQAIKQHLSSSTIAGVNFYCRASKSKFLTMWCASIAVALVGCIALCRKGCLDYVQYSVRTNVHLKVPIEKSALTDHVSIPNLSFCSLKTIKKNIYHNDQLAREYVLRSITAYMPPNTNISQWRKEYDRYCPSSNFDEEKVEPINFDVFINAKDLYKEWLEMVCKIWTTRRDMVIRCSWKGLGFPCNSPSDPIMFSDSYTDDGMCFLFQYDQQWVRNMSNKIELVGENSFLKSRPHDLSVIFDLKQYQRCGHPVPTRGEGLYITAFDRRTLAQTNMLQSTFRIHPGYEYKIKIKTVIIQRLTEHLNRCTSKGFASIDDRIGPLSYTKGTCQAIILLKDIVRKCNCWPPTPIWMKPYMNKKNTGLDIDSLKSCSDSMEGISCLMQYILTGTLNTLNTDDRHCMDPCVEPKYNTFTFAMNKLTKIYVKSLGIPLVMGTQPVNDTNTEDWIQKNIIVLHVDFESENFDAMIEVQLFTFFDLLRYIASAFGLFFGFSVISFFEIFFVIVRFCFV